MIPRAASRTIQRLASSFPVVAITGPRQSGKTTLAKSIFPDKPYASLEDPDFRALAETDPRGFLAGFPEGAVLDEAQRAPHLFSYLQTRVDEDRTPGRFVLTGSQQFGLMSGISQSLAGRVGLVHLLPFSGEELRAVGQLPATLEALLATGFYPPLYDRNIRPGDWFAGYVATYVERDVRQMINVRDLSAFQRFVKMCAARTGQLLNLSSLAADCGITHNTASAWLSVLEASFLVYLLRPHHRNFNKRLIKAPKLYFLDVGLAAWLMGVQAPQSLAFHSARGNLFETYVLGEILKSRFNQGLPANLYYWRDSQGLEIDLLLEAGEDLVPVEIKSGQTIASDFFNGLERWSALAHRSKRPSWLVYGGNRQLKHGATTVLPWNQFVNRLPGCHE
jgi:uncharacterized protein